jgi:hypothetical protein
VALTYTPEEYQSILESNNQILVELENLENQGWDKKKDRIKKYVDNSRILLDAGKLPVGNKKEFASYIYHKLSEYTTVSRNGNDFYSLFKDDEIKDSMSRIVDEKATNISSGQTVDEIFREQVLKAPQKKDEYTQHFDNIISNSSESQSLAEALKEKYNESEELSEVMIKELGDIDKLLEQDIEIGSVLSLARKNIDDRNKWGNYEKLVAQFLINVGETKAELAKKLNYCSKYASIGIERSEELTRYWQFLGQCPHCKTDVHNFFDLQIQKYLKNEELDISLPLKGY